MYYEINVSKEVQSYGRKGFRHLFATTERSITSIYELKRQLPIFMEKFPESEGYRISVSHWQKTGHDVDVDAILEEIENEN